jgi:hypothetical protein
MFFLLGPDLRVHNRDFRHRQFQQPLRQVRASAGVDDGDEKRKQRSAAVLKRKQIPRGFDEHLAARKDRNRCVCSCEGVSKHVEEIKWSELTSIKK